MGEIVSLSAKQLDAKELIRDLHQLKRNWSSHPELPVLSPRIINELLANVTTLENKLWDKSRSFVVAVLASPGLLFLAVPSRIFPIANILSFLFWTGLIGCPCYLFACAAKVQYRYTVYALTQVDDLRALSPLIQATRY